MSKKSAATGFQSACSDGVALNALHGRIERLETYLVGRILLKPTQDVQRRDG